MRPVKSSTLLLALAALISQADAALIVTSVAREASLSASLTGLPGSFDQTATRTISSTAIGTFNVGPQVDISTSNDIAQAFLDLDADQTSSVLDNAISARLFVDVHAFLDVFSPATSDQLRVQMAARTSLAVDFTITEPERYQLAGWFGSIGFALDVIEFGPTLTVHDSNGTLLFTLPDQFPEFEQEFPPMIFGPGSYSLFASTRGVVDVSNFWPIYGLTSSTVVFTLTAVPEPSSIGLAAVGGAGVLLIWRRRHRLSRFTKGQS